MREDFTGALATAASASIGGDTVCQWIRPRFRVADRVAHERSLCSNAEYPPSSSGWELITELADDMAAMAHEQSREPSDGFEFDAFGDPDADPDDNRFFD